MTLSTDWGNKFLDEYADQVNKLEAQAKRTGAPAVYNKALENEFNKVKEQFLGSSKGSCGKGSSGGSGKAGSGTTGGSTAGGHGGTTGSGGMAGGGTAGSSGGTTGTGGTAGGGTAGSSGGTTGSSGTAGGGTVGSRGGTTGSSGTAGSGTGGDASGIEPSKSLTASLGDISRIAGRDAAKAVEKIIEGGVIAFGGLLGAGGLAFKNAIGRAGANAAEFASAHAGDAAVDAVTGAKLAEAAGEIIKKAGGSVSQMADAAAAVGAAILRGGIEAGKLVLGAIGAAVAVGGPGAAAAGVEAAEAEAEAINAAAHAFGDNPDSILQVAKAVRDQAEFGGPAAHAAANAVKARAYTKGEGEFGPDDVNLFKDDAATAGDAVVRVDKGIGLLGGTAQGRVEIVKSVVEASNFGADTAQAAAKGAFNSANYASKHHSIGHNKMEDALGGARIVSDTAAAVKEHGGSFKDISDAVNAVAGAAKLVGFAGANDAAQSFKNAIASGEDVHDAVGAPKAVVKALNKAKAVGLSQDQRTKLADDVRDASKSGSAAARDVADTFESMMNSGNRPSKNDAIEAAKDVSEAAQDGGVKAADAMAQTAEKGGISAVRDAIKEVRHMKALGGTPDDVANIAELFATAAKKGVTKNLLNFTEQWSQGVNKPKLLYDLARSGLDAYIAAGQDGIKLVTGVITSAEQMFGASPELAVKGAKIVSEELQGYTAYPGSVASPYETVREVVNSAGALAKAAKENPAGENPADVFLDHLRAGATSPGASVFAVNGMPAPPQSAAAGSVYTVNDPPSPQGQQKSKLNDSWNALTHDLRTGADKATIEKDAQQLAAVAGQLNDPVLQQVALLAGSGFYKDSSDALQFLQDAAQGHGNPFDYYPDAPPALTDPLQDPWQNENDHSPLNDAYLTLEVDLSSGADKQKIKDDAERVKQLAGSDHPGLADAADNISKNIDDPSYDQIGGLTALMNNPPNGPAAAPPSPPPSSPPPPQSIDEATAYQKLLDDTNGGDISSMAADARQLAFLAIQNGDDHLAQVALDIVDVVQGTNLDIPALDGITNYGPSAADALKNAAPGTPAARGDA